MNGNYALSQTSRYAYEAQINASVSSGNVKFYLPDVGRGIYMIAMNGADTLDA